MVANIYHSILSAAAAGCGGSTTTALQNSSAAPLKCPRCDSPNTKFCYYNNYSLAQPRHFCRACKRYWTRGGTLRDVPVGGGRRKNKRRKQPQSAAAAAALPLPPPLRQMADSLPSPVSLLCSPNMPPANLENRFFFMNEETIQAPLPCFDALPTGICERLGLRKGNPMEGMCFLSGSGSAAAESAYLYSWPGYCSPAVRLL